MSTASAPPATAPTILCLASYYKGNRFLEECKRQGCHVILLTLESLLNEPWARGSIDEVFAMPSFANRDEVFRAVSYLARTREIARLAPLDDFDVELAAALREHLRVPGMGDTTARYFRDKLAMRMRAREHGIRVPDFVHVLNHDRVRRYLAEVPGPWVLKPRAEASAVGIQKLHHADDVWRALDALGDRQSFFLLERMIPGDVYHVDAIVAERAVVFAEAHKYRRPILEVTQEGGIFATRTLPREGDERRALLAMNAAVVAAFGLVRGVTHTEMIRGKADGEYYFLETAARVGGANISDLVEAATGIDLWAEWAKIELAQGTRPYALPPARADYAGLVVSLARQERPDTSGFDDPEVVWRLTEKAHHLGLIVRAPTPTRVESLIESYVPRIQRDFQAVLPPPDKPTS